MRYFSVALSEQGMCYDGRALNYNLGLRTEVGKAISVLSFQT